MAKKIEKKIEKEIGINIDVIEALLPEALEFPPLERLEGDKSTHYEQSSGGEKFEKLKVELTEKNERIFREMYQFMERTYSFERFINDWIAESLYSMGFE